MEIHERIKMLRIQRHLSQKHVANNLGVSSSEVAQMESGTRGIMAEDLQKLCVLFRVSADTLLFDEIPERQSAEIARRIEILDDRDQAEIMNIIHFRPCCKSFKIKIMYNIVDFLLHFNFLNVHCNN